MSVDCRKESREVSCGHVKWPELAKNRATVCLVTVESDLGRPNVQTWCKFCCLCTTSVCRMEALTYQTTRRRIEEAELSPRESNFMLQISKLFRF